MVPNRSIQPIRAVGNTKWKRAKTLTFIYTINSQQNKYNWDCGNGSYSHAHTILKAGKKCFNPGLNSRSTHSSTSLPLWCNNQHLTNTSTDKRKQKIYLTSVIFKTNLFYQYVRSFNNPSVCPNWVLSSFSYQVNLLIELFMLVFFRDPILLFIHGTLESQPYLLFFSFIAFALVKCSISIGMYKVVYGSN